jgi:glycosyltransferase involved in cell wall biosynthesis
MENKFNINNISVVVPSYNNLEYLKSLYKSVRQISSEIELIMFSDGSTDGTKEWLEQLNDSNSIIKCYNERKGHTLLYDEGFLLATKKIIGILHADMIVNKNFFNSIIKHITANNIVCGTCIEPPLHPPGGEKHILDLGMYPNEFDENKFNSFCNDKDINQISEGIFAPWFLLKDDYISKIGKHDIRYAPYGYEDSDLFTRMALANFNFIQSRDAFVYHFTQRGHKWTKGVGIENIDYQYQMGKTRKEYIRKFGSDPKFDFNHKPTPLPKYNVAYVVKHINLQVIGVFEPWCDRIYIEDEMGVLQAAYYETEQKNTSYDLKKRVLTIGYNDPMAENDIVVEFDYLKFSPEAWEILQQLPNIIKESGEVGTFELDIFKITINSMTEYQNDLIYLKNN